MEPTDQQSPITPQPGEVIVPPTQAAAPQGSTIAPHLNEVIAPAFPGQVASQTPNTKHKGVLGFAITLFTLAVLMVAYLVPGRLQSITSSSQSPNIVVLLLSGAIIIVITALLLGYVQSRFRLGAAWFIGTLVFTVIIVGLKFILAPASLYQQTFQYGPGANSNFNPNSLGVTVLYSAAVLFLYLMALYGVYWVFKDKLRKDPQMQGPVRAKKGPGALAIWGLVIIAFLLIPYILNSESNAAQYLGYLAQAYGLLLLAGVAFGLVAAYLSFQSAYKQAVQRRDATILAICFWVALCVVITYSVAGAIFIAALVKLWPFKSVYIPLSSSGK